MKLLLTLILLFSSVLTKHQERYFEGVIHFEMAYSNIHEGLSEDFVKSYSGDRMTYFHDISEGYFEQYYHSNNLVNTRWYEYETNKLSMIVAGNDTLFHYQANETSYSHAIQETNEREIICGYSCKKYVVTLTPYNPNDYPISYEYYVATDLLVNHKLFEGFIDGGYYDVLQRSSGIILKLVYHGPYYTKIRTATNIQRTKVKLRKLIPKDNFIPHKIEN